MSALTNPITKLKYEGVAQLQVSVLNCLDEICDFLIQTANNNPELKVCFKYPHIQKHLFWPSLLILRNFLIYMFRSQIYVEPPLHRCQPYWFNTNFALITSAFASSFKKCPDRILFLPAFDCSPTSFNVDGVHLTQGEGER